MRRIELSEHHPRRLNPQEELPWLARRLMKGAAVAKGKLGLATDKAAAPTFEGNEMRIPAYVDGKPANLQAAIVDAEYWLRWLRSRINEQRPPVELNEYRARMRPELIEKLRLAIRALEEFLPDHPEYILSTVEGPTEEIDDDSGNVPPPLPGDDQGDTIRRLKGADTVKARYCKVCSCELDEFNLAKQGDHICRKCKEARQELGPVQQAKFDLIKEKLRAKQQRMEISEG